MIRFLVTGASGQLGSYLLRELRLRGASVVAWSGSRTGEHFANALRPVDLRDAGAVADAFADARPEVIIHTAALSAVADCARDPQAAMAINRDGTAHLARLASQAGARLVYISTDMVFDGERAPYREDDACMPLSAYARSKVEAENAVLATAGTVIVRVSLLFGPSLSHRPTLFDRQRQALAAQEPLTLFHDEWRTPLDLTSAARGLLAIAASDCAGILHFGGPERMSRLQMGERLARVLECPGKITAVSRNSGGQHEPRPRDVSLDSSRWRRLFPNEPLPPFEEAVRQMVERCGKHE
jgi:dTDP-4-dehydrorhamnose reductase